MYRVTTEAEYFISIREHSGTHVSEWHFASWFPKRENEGFRKVIVGNQSVWRFPGFTEKRKIEILNGLNTTE